MLESQDPRALPSRRRLAFSVDHCTSAGCSGEAAPLEALMISPKYWKTGTARNVASPGAALSFSRLKGVRH